MCRYDVGRVTEMRRIAHVFLMAVVDREGSHWKQDRNGGRLEFTADIPLNENQRNKTSF